MPFTAPGDLHTLTEVTSSRSKRKQPLGYVRETEKINQRKKAWANKVHKFMPAEWTHPNGHPRCKLCGSEEPIGGMCNKEPSARDRRKFQEELDAEFSSVAKHGHPDDPLYRVLYHAHGRGFNGEPSSASAHGPRRNSRMRASIDATSSRRIAESVRGQRAASESARRRSAEVPRSPRRLGGREEAEAQAHGTPTEPKRGDNLPKKRVIRNRSLITPGQVEAVKLPGKAPSNLQNDARDYANKNLTRPQEKYAGLIIRLAGKGLGQDPRYRGDQSKKYGIPLSDMFDIEQKMYEIMYPQHVRHHEAPSVRFDDMPDVQRAAIRANGGRSASVYPLEKGEPWSGSPNAPLPAATRKNPDRLFKATKGEHRGKYLRVNSTGVVTVVPDKQAEKDLEANKAHAKAVAQQLRVHPRRWNKDRTQLVDIKEWEREQEAIRQEYADKEEQQKAIKAQKIRIAQEWAKEQGYDESDSYWWGYYWNDPSLIKSQDEAASGNQPVRGAPIPRAPRRAKRKVDLPAAEATQKEMRGHRPGPRRDITIMDTPELQDLVRESVKASQKKTSSRQRRKVQKRDPFNYIAKQDVIISKMPANVPGHVYHFKHGWIPLDHPAAKGMKTPKVSGAWDHANKVVADRKLISRPQRGSTHIRPGIKGAYEDPARAIYDRNNGTTKIDDKRLAQIFEDPSKMTAKERAMIGSATTAAKLDGEKMLTVNTSRGKRQLARYNVMAQIRSKISPGSGDRSTKSTSISESVREGKNAKRRESGKPSAPEMERIAKKVVAMWSTDGGKTVICTHCHGKLSARGISLETPKSKKLGGNYRDIPGIWPSHHKCNSAAGNKGIKIAGTRRMVSAQEDPKTYLEEMMRRFDQLPPTVKARLPEVYKYFRKYLGSYEEAKKNGFRSVTKPTSRAKRKAA